jgi:hypothetical protein
MLMFRDLFQSIETFGRKVDTMTLEAGAAEIVKGLLIQRSGNTTEAAEIFSIQGPADTFDDLCW